MSACSPGSNRERARGRGILSGLLGALAVAGCGGSGGDGAAEGVTAGTPLTRADLLPAYDFALGDVGGVSNRLVATSTLGGPAPIDITIDFRIEPAIGRYTLADKTLVFENAAIAVEGDYGPIVVDVVEPLRLAPGGVPDDVALGVSVTVEGDVSLRFSGGLVEMQLNNDPPQTLTFEEFEALVRSQSLIPVWHRQSSLAWVALDLLRHVVTAAADSLTSIDESLAAAIIVERTCDAFTGSPPPGELNQGMARLTWLGAVRIETGDRFRWDFTSCWLDAPGTADVLLDGGVDLRGYSARVENGTLTRFGYESVGSNAGGMFFDGLEISATVESAPLMFEAAAGRRFSLTRGVRIAFTAP